MCLNLKTFVKMVKFLSLAANLGYIPRVQKPGPRPMALAWLWLSKNSGWAKAHPRPKFRPGLAWPGFWTQAGAGTSLWELHEACLGKPRHWENGKWNETQMGMGVIDQ